MTYRERSNSKGWGRPVREEKAGNIYYVRLKTPVGHLYKLGFTTMSTAHERFAFQGARHEKLIDRVFVFAYSLNAFSIEQTLHGHFESKQAFGIPEAMMPLAGNGQSEVYVEDILGLDEDFTHESAQIVRARIQALRTGQPYLHGVKAESEQNAGVNSDVQAVLNMRFGWPISWIWRAWCIIDRALFLDGAKQSYDEKVRGMIRWLRETALKSERERERFGSAACESSDEAIKAMILQCAKMPSVEFKFPSFRYDAISDFIHKQDWSCEWYPDYAGLRCWAEIAGSSYSVNVDTMDANQEGASGVVVSVDR